jgi:hypothetical protein
MLYICRPGAYRKTIAIYYWDGLVAKVADVSCATELLTALKRGTTSGSKAGGVLAW